MNRLNESLSLLAVLVLAAGVMSCEPSDTPGAQGEAKTIAIECTDELGNAIVENGVQVVQVDVGESIHCQIDVADLPIETEEGLQALPPQYEWAFSSTDGGSLYPNDSKGIHWDVDPFYRTLFDLDEDCAAAVTDGNAAADLLESCATVCCQTGPSDFELLNQGDCSGPDRKDTDLWRCPSRNPQQPVCCELPIEYPNGTANPDFVHGYRQITTLNTCLNYCECTAACDIGVDPVIQCGEPIVAYGPGGPDPRDFTTKCDCCRLPDDSIRAADGDCVEGLGGELIDWEECWDHPEPCGSDDQCDVTFCEATDGSVEIEREDLCIAGDGEALGASHDGSTLLCCKRTTTEEFFPISILGSHKRVSAETEHWFEALSEGTVTIRMRQLIAPPILFTEAYPGSSLLQIRIGPLVSSCVPDFNISGTFAERYNCAEGPSCVDQDVETTITIVAGSETGQYSFSAGGWSGSGTLCGSEFEWTAASSSFSETGTWFFSDANNFTKSSSYTYSSGGGGTCTGSASSNGSPPPPAPIGPCP